MSSPEIREWLDHVIAGTNSGEIKWNQMNPTTYSWVQAPPKTGQVILQRVERLETVQIANRAITQKKVTQHILQAVDPGKRPGAVVLNGSLDPELNSQLEKLFEIVSNVATSENLSFLKSLLPNAGPNAS